MPTILALDTSTEACTVALNHQGQIFQRFEIAPRRHAEIILSMIESLFQETKLTSQQVDAIAYGCGPGSFMGIRIAAGVTQGLAYGADKLVIPVSSLRALAQTAYDHTQHEHVIAAWDARMHEIYWGVYQAQNGLMQPIKPDTISSATDIHLPDAREWVLVGNAWEIYAENFGGDLILRKNQVLAGFFPTASAIVKIVLQEWQSDKLLSAEKALPVYLRDQVAEPKKPA